MWSTSTPTLKKTKSKTRSTLQYRIYPEVRKVQLPFLDLTIYRPKDTKPVTSAYTQQYIASEGVVKNVKHIFYVIRLDATPTKPSVIGSTNGRGLFNSERSRSLRQSTGQKKNLTKSTFVEAKTGETWFG